MEEEVKIIGRSDDETTVAKMLYQAGYALSLWYNVEENIASFYAKIVCADGAFVDGAIATFQSLHTLDQKVTLAAKVMAQVLYQDELKQFRQQAKKGLNRILTLNQTRNKVAHGRVVWGGFGGANGPRFGPYYMEAAHMRANFIKSVKLSSSVIEQPELWTLEDLSDKVQSLGEGLIVSRSLLTDLGSGPIKVLAAAAVR